MYEGLLEHYTTISGITPEEIFSIGTEEVKMLKQKMAVVAEKLGFGKNINVKQFLEERRENQDQKFKSKNETLSYIEGNLKITKKLLTWNLEIEKQLCMLNRIEKR
jgi:uncharacterized protein (DUF885 family)